MKTIIPILLLFFQLNAVAQRTIVLAETFSFPGCEHSKVIDVVKYYDRSIAFIDWYRDSTESEYRCRRRLENGGSDSTPGLYLEGFIEIDLDSIYSELPEKITEVLAKEPGTEQMTIRYDFSPGSIKVTVFGNGGDFWFVTKVSGSNKPFRVFNTYISPNQYEYIYPVDRSSNETEFIAWIQGIGITDNVVILKLPKYRKN